MRPPGEFEILLDWLDEAILKASAKERKNRRRMG
jgi:hypothetical protein